MDKGDHPFIEKINRSRGRYVLLFWSMILFFLLLAGRLWYLQVLKGPELLNRSETNRIVMVDLPPVRGLIMDRNGVVLVDNRATFDLVVKKSEIKDAEPLLAEIASATGRSLGSLIKKYRALPKKTTNFSVLIHALNREELVALETRRYRLPGASIEVNYGRQPLSDVLASHLLGYLGGISSSQLKAERLFIKSELRRLVREGETREAAQTQIYSRYKPHRIGDLVGQSGVEQSLEFELQGRRGYAVREVDSRGRIVKEMGGVNPEPGHNIRLTIDSRLQAVAMSLLNSRAGAIVVIDPRNFEILALASSPTFRLSDFTGGINAQRWSSLIKDRFHPLINRAISGQYPPGSTFKIVVALAALAEGVITPRTTFHCSGSLQTGDITLGCHNRFGHGTLDLKGALTYSCDVYFYEVGRRLGINRLVQFAREFFGLGRCTGIDLRAEAAGVIPDPEWKQRTKGQKWTPGETMLVSIGQGSVLTTPLQVAQYTAMVANRGRLFRPQLLKDIIDVEGRLVRNVEPEIISQMNIDSQIMKAVRESLEAVVDSPWGTGRRAALPGLRVSGKTGTSQVVSNKVYQNYSSRQLPYEYRDHAWFTSYAPSDEPEVVVTVLLENTGGGGVYAAPLAKQMLAAFFNPSIMAAKLPRPQLQPDREQDDGIYFYRGQRD
ncbi:MAG: penicillin-binding protein 2 [Candidatus Adiutrix intracellularis]|jgi:penicillin-binding protein 2|nr:penicillin-binding protein 2 [Candidatus Adiutrix intracellularis]